MMQTLIIGDMRGLADETAGFLQSGGAKVATSEDIGGAIHHLRKSKKCDLALIDADLDIRRFVSQLQVERLSLPIVACGSGGATAAKRALAHGAQEFLPLPAQEKDLAKMLRLPDGKISKTAASKTATKTDAYHDTGGIICSHSSMLTLLEQAGKFAQSRAHIFISGETGCGKELLAHYIHSHSKRAEQAFVAVNCAAIVDNLLESELFGHTKGAFTGAIAEHKGKFELAHKGTLLLDEISEMDLRLQAKLLRAIQERQIDKVGGTQPIAVDLRIVVTSNRNIIDEVAAGRFREDLYYRLNVMELYIPPLRERREDIGLLAEHFARKFAGEYELPYQALSAKAISKLKTHHFPGNVRELENIMHRAVILANGEDITDNMIVLNFQKIKKH